jgi:hypothetical protein
MTRKSWLIWIVGMVHEANAIDANSIVVLFYNTARGVSVLEISYVSILNI